MYTEDFWLPIIKKLRESKNKNHLKINFTSPRIRKALEIINGIREGRDLGELLGLKFERILTNTLVQSESVIQILRRIFPVSENPKIPLKLEGMDGLKLLSYLDNHKGITYPFEFSDLPTISVQDSSYFMEAIAQLELIFESIADLLISEAELYKIHSEIHDHT